MVGISIILFRCNLHPEISFTFHDYTMLLEQRSNVNKNDKTKRKLVSYLHIFKPEIIFTENRKLLYIRNFAKIKKCEPQFSIYYLWIFVLFHLVASLVYISTTPKKCSFINSGSKKSCYLGLGGATWWSKVDLFLVLMVRSIKLTP